uniref:Putative secreted protein n=1 Tax=Ixodes ricinus TaxID=34613 RepID=A0A6B0UPA9_IXORI
MLLPFRSALLVHMFWCRASGVHQSGRRMKNRVASAGTDDYILHCCDHKRWRQHTLCQWHEDPSAQPGFRVLCDHRGHSGATDEWPWSPSQSSKGCRKRRQHHTDVLCLEPGPYGSSRPSRHSR